MPALSQDALATLFLDARSHNGWSDAPVTEADIRRIYDLAKWGPTSANSSPARFVWVQSEEGRARLAACASGANSAKILAAPVTVIIARDPAFYRHIERLFPHSQEMQALLRQPEVAKPTAQRNATLQGAYLMLAARALGFDIGPMSGFDMAKVNAEFLAEHGWEADWLCSIGHGNGENMYPRLPRLDFDEAGTIV
jgi:3-hydroxypropanoate dehydrogenase